MARQGLGERLQKLFARGISEDEVQERLEDILLEADVNSRLAMEISDELFGRRAVRKLRELDAVRDAMLALLLPRLPVLRPALDESGMPVVVMLGVNGVGKTTTCAKLARYYVPRVKGPVVLGAADTFRAAAVEQLQRHGEALGLRVVAQKQGSDPAAVAWDAAESAQARGAGMLILDTAGRMHTRTQLVEELGKLLSVIPRAAAGARVFRMLVVDATTGQNARHQAETFSDAVGIDGYVLAKADSSGRGGAVLNLGAGLGIPGSFVGTGESLSDLQEFNPETLLRRILGMDE